jgi:hypothetical protein
MSDGQIESCNGAQVTHLHEAASARERLSEASRLLLRAPRTVADTGLPAVFLGRLVLKSTLLNGKSSFGDLSQRHRLPVAVLEDLLAFLVRERLAEITHRGSSDIDVHFRLTEAGRAVATEELSRCSYSGPAPVSYDSYVEVVREHSVRHQRITQAEVRTAFEGICIEPALLDAAAASLNAGRPLMLYGPAGSGKTFLAERLGQLLKGGVPIPYAVYVGGEIIQMHDPLLHHDAPAAAAVAAGDKRWRICRRPVALSGGELTLEALDLRYDTSSGFYQAPPHMKANMGLYIVDDLGRQRVAPHELLNRWIMPLDRNVDLFTLRSGTRFSAPFDVWPVFSSNLDPAAIGDEAFLRRLGSKLHVGPLTLENYRTVFEACCQSLKLDSTPVAFDYLLHNLHMPTGKPFLACYPRDLLRLVSASADYKNAPREVTTEALREAWQSYFGAIEPASRYPASRYPPNAAAKRAGKKFAAG